MKPEAARRRFGLLPPTCQEVLLVAAAIGTEFAVATLSRVCRREVDQVRRALDGEAADLVSAVPGADGIYRFADPCMRSVLYDEIPPARRPWLERQIAANLEGRSGNRSRGHECPPSGRILPNSNGSRVTPSAARDRRNARDDCGGHADA